VVNWRRSALLYPLLLRSYQAGPPGRFPIAALWMEILELVDEHSSAKQEIRFSHEECAGGGSQGLGRA
jgi:hypothetical protein